MTTNLEWKEEYLIGNYEIDAQHQMFLKLIRKIDKAFKVQNENVILSGLIEELYKYADFHFISEENQMIMEKYPNYQMHKQEHEKLLRKLSNIISTFEVKYVDFDELVLFLLEWFKNHTTTLDKLFGNYLLQFKMK